MIKIKVKIPLMLTILLALSFHVFAQGAKPGKISGKLIDESNGSVIIGGAVRLEGTEQGSLTDVEGRYLIEDVPPGNYTLLASNSNFEKKTATVTVKSGTVSNIDFALKGKSVAITFVGTKPKGSINGLIDEQKRLPNFGSGISSEQIAKSPDANSAQAIKRVSGATLQDGRFAIIRGLNDRYNSAMINGSPLPSTEAERRAFSFDLIPSNMLDNIMIIKTATPDLPGDFAGGIIQINTKDVPSTPFFQVNLGTGYNSITTGKTFNAYQGGKYDWLGFDDGSRTLPKDFPDQKGFDNTNPNQKFALAKELPNNWGILSRNAAPNINAQFSMGNTFKLGKDRLGIIMSLSYNKTLSFNSIERNWYSNKGDAEFNYLDSQYVRRITNGAMLNFAYKLGNFTKFSFKNSYTHSSEDQTTVRSGNQLVEGFYQRSFGYVYTANDLMLSQFSGEHFLPTSKIKVNYFLSYGYLGKQIPDRRNITYQRDISDPTAQLSNVVQQTVTEEGGARFFAKLGEDIYNGGYNVSIPTDFLKLNWLEGSNGIKVGGYHSFRRRSFDSRIIGYSVYDNSTFDQNLYVAPLAKLFDPSHFGKTGFSISEITNASNYYRAGSDLNCAYLMLDNKIFTKFRFVWGARLESYRQTLGPDPDHTSSGLFHIDSTVVDILPSANLTYALTSRSNLRLAGYETVARPEFRELAPFSYFDFSTNSKVIGNPALKRTSIWNGDFKYEFYPSPGQIIAVSTFYKKFTDPVELYIPVPSGSDIVRSFTNAKGAENYGVEFEFRQTLNIFADSVSYLDNFTLFGNLAYIKSKVHFEAGTDVYDAGRPMQGQSPFIINVGLQYVEPKSKLNIVILYNRFGDRVYSVGSKDFADIYEKGRDVLDIQLSRSFLKKNKLEVKATASDLFGKDLLFYQDLNRNGQYNESSDHVFFKYKMPKIVSIGAVYKF